MRVNNQKPYTPKEGKIIINKAWERLEKSDHEREKTFRQQKLEQLASRYNRKAIMRETWLSECQRLGSTDNFGFNLAVVEAAAKKYEAMRQPFLPTKNVFRMCSECVAVSNELEVERYCDMKRTAARKENVLRHWNYLLELLCARRMRMEFSIQLQQNFQKTIYTLDSIEEEKQRLLTDDYGNLMGVEDLLQKHSDRRRNINTINTQLQDVQRIMVQNIDDVLQCGTVHSELDIKTQNLSVL
ncbi:spectrin beta chain-like [Toxorhynchites rutilus septentrionalis]|uniref:spectrin beta chain-like n=1 Tax=Toxorhynchites rutilus septentrionalis TaxID=329112 RepID=UPI00247AE5E4|nr:spectrin beta chain-like [Toxorhynchites rutilus septentrionalis]